MIEDKKVLYFYKKEGENTIENSEIELDLVPQTVNYTYSPNFSSQSVLGRLSPIQIYTSGSDITYSFSVTLHEDLIYKQGKTIGELFGGLHNFVDRIKSLSYPEELTGHFKNVYFQIGEISGVGIVNTSVGWRKPFRKGRYIVADINFNIVEIRRFGEVNMRTIHLDSDNVKAVELSKAYSAHGSAFPLISGILETGNYNASYTNLISSEESEEVRKAHYEQYAQLFEYQTKVLSNLFSTAKDSFGKKETDKAYIDKFSKTFNSLKKYGIDITNNVVTGYSLKDIKEIEKIGKALKKEVEEYFKYRYDGNKDILLSEYKNAINKVDEIIKDIVDSIIGMGVYGSKN